MHINLGQLPGASSQDLEVQQRVTTIRRLLTFINRGLDELERPGSTSPQEAERNSVPSQAAQAAAGQASQAAQQAAAAGNCLTSLIVLQDDYDSFLQQWRLRLQRNWLNRPRLQYLPRSTADRRNQAWSSG